MDNFKIFFLLGLLQFGYTKKINEVISICSKSSPDFNECVKTSANKLLGIIANKGLKEYGLVKLDPLKVPFIELNQAQGSVGLKLSIYNSSHAGLKQAVIDKIRYDVTKEQVEFEMKMPRYELQGNYKVGGRILVLPIEGNGRGNITAYDVKCKVTLNFKDDTRNSKKYCKLYNVRVGITIGDAKFQTEGLFDGNRQLSETMLNFLNSNALLVLNEVKPTMEKTWTELFLGLLKLVFDQITCSDLILP